MYERSAIVLERYIEKILKFDKQYNLRNNYINFKGLIEELENYQIIATKEGKIIQEFDDTVKKIESIQKEQEKIHNSNLKLEEDRNKLFNDLDENPETLEKKFNKIEISIEENNNKLIELRSKYTIYVSDFIEKQKERNKCEKERRLSETTHIEHVKESTAGYESIDTKDILFLKQIINAQKEEQEKEISNIMVKNGKNEKVAFNQDVLKIAINTRIDIAEREANCYISIYDKMKKLLTEIDSDNIKLNKYKKALRDVSIKLAFLNAEKEYIVGFLDYERMTAISGTKMHNKMMEEACKNFESDIIQINNLYELILREITNKATKKAYKELYNKTYLKNIEDKEKNFEQEVTNIKINMGTVINSNYWRIEGIKNIYDIFQKEVSEKFEKDLSEFNDEEENKEIEIKEEVVKEEKKNKKEKFKLTFSDEEDEDSIDENDFEDDEMEELDDDESDYDASEEDEDYYDEDDEIDEDDENSEDYFEDDDSNEEEYDDEFFDDDEDFDFEEYDDESEDEDEDDDEDEDEDEEFDDEFFEEDDNDEIEDEDFFEDEEDDEEDEEQEKLVEEDNYVTKKEKKVNKKNTVIKADKKPKKKEEKDTQKKENEKLKDKEPKKQTKTNKGLFDKILKIRKIN